MMLERLPYPTHSFPENEMQVSELGVCMCVCVWRAGTKLDKIDQRISEQLTVKRCSTVSLYTLCTMFQNNQRHKEREEPQIAFKFTM